MFAIVFSIFLFAAILSSVPTQHALAVSTIDFEDFPDGTVITNQYENDGASFSASPAAIIFSDPTEATSGVNVLVPPPPGIRSGEIDINIVDPVSHSATDASSISFNLISIGMNPVIVTAKDSGGNTLNTQTFGPHSPSDGQGNVDPYTFSNPNIRSIIISGNVQTGDGYGIDDVLVGFSSVPVGGVIIPIDMVSLFVAGISTNAFWMAPTVVGITGAALALFKIKRKHELD